MTKRGIKSRKGAYQEGKGLFEQRSDRPHLQGVVARVVGEHDRFEDGAGAAATGERLEERAGGEGNFSLILRDPRVLDVTVDSGDGVLVVRHGGDERKGGR
jgi:hypothetical protein